MRSSWGDKGQGQSDDSCSLYMLAVIHCSPVHLQHYKHNSAACTMTSGNSAIRNLEKIFWESLFIFRSDP